MRPPPSPSLSHTRVRLSSFFPRQDLENQYELKLAIEMERYDKLSDLLERERQTFKSALTSLNAKRESEVHSLSQEIMSKQREIEVLQASKEVRRRVGIDICP